MKKFITLVLFLVLFGCADRINLRKGEILSKTTYNDVYAQYQITDNGDQGFCTQFIYAAPDFAEVGDTIGSVDGVIKVIKKAEKTEK